MVEGGNRCFDFRREEESSFVIRLTDRHLAAGILAGFFTNLSCFLFCPHASRVSRTFLCCRSLITTGGDGESTQSRHG